MIRGILVAEYPENREKIIPFLHGFAGRDLDGITVAQLEESILDRDKQVWSVNDFQAVCMTCVTTDAVRIERCAGVRRHEWQAELDDEIRAWAKALGKRRVVILGRPGWKPWAKNRGYREIHCELAVEV